MAGVLSPLRGGVPSSRLRRAVLRAPIWLYKLGLGRLLGHRLVLLTHTGRKSGRRRHVVLEVVERGAEPGDYFVASGYGAKSQWFQNILAQPAVTYQVGGRTYRGAAVPLSPDDSGRRLAWYAQRNPKLAAGLMGALGHDPQTQEDYEALGADREDGVPIVGLRPR